jgi:hypothetical protein
LRRSFGQQIASVFGTTPMLPGRIGMAQVWPCGQQIAFLSVTQHERPLGQHDFPQQRLVRRSQHFVPHSSSFFRHRLQSPVASLTHCHFGGQHLSLPHQAWPCGHRFVQTFCDPAPNRAVRHSSFGWQQTGPHPRSSFLQQRFCCGLAQNSSLLQQVVPPHGLPHGFFLHPAPYSTGPQSHSYSSLGVQQILWQTAPLQLHSHNNPPFGTQSWKLDAARAFLAAIPGTAVATSAPPITRTARRRGIDVASARARSSKN